MFGRFQLGLQFLFGLSDVLVHLLPLLFLHLLQSFPARCVFELECPRLSKMGWLLSFPSVLEKKDRSIKTLQTRTEYLTEKLHLLMVLWNFLHQFFWQSILIIKVL